MLTAVTSPANRHSNTFFDKRSIRRGGFCLVFLGFVLIDQQTGPAGDDIGPQQETSHNFVWVSDKTFCIVCGMALIALMIHEHGSPHTKCAIQQTLNPSPIDPEKTDGFRREHTLIRDQVGKRHPMQQRQIGEPRCHRLRQCQVRLRPLIRQMGQESFGRLQLFFVGVGSFPVEQIDGDTRLLQRQQATKLPGGSIGNIKHAVVFVVAHQFIGGADGQINVF